MANHEHVAELGKGVESWNQWRENHPRMIPLLQGADLQGADLKGAYLQRANLQKANLQEANLQEANLQGADLQEANLQEANLQEANLQGTNLQKADLQWADLQRANLQKAYLQEANLQRAKLQKANLQEANLQEANLQGTNLQEANLQGADLQKAYLQEANLQGTNIAGLSASFATVDGDTLIDTDLYDRDTDFSGVGLDSARIEESLKSALKRNIRQKYWERRYKKNWLLNIVRPFWWASDYGSSTKRIIFSFWLTSFIFSFVYLIPVISTFFAHPFLADFGDEMLNKSPCSNYLGWGCSVELWFRSLYFSVVTMTTLGFGDIHAHRWSMTGQALVMLQVLIGYVLLGALITRLSILFQDVG
ncbi:pentapeptide repeat-containing protein [Acaryochloris marina]|uniref:pentapeptide repeat-containing protein n=1 Tax=Acaryochloris marina TaxID=155978 RepID=UPI0021C2BE0A|nr:pentapeptide repeat-containing protein [Acaryochloris marina]